LERSTSEVTSRDPGGNVSADRGGSAAPSSSPFHRDHESRRSRSPSIGRFEDGSILPTQWSQNLDSAPPGAPRRHSPDRERNRQAERHGWNHERYSQTFGAISVVWECARA